MFPKTNLKRDLADPTEPPSKRIKNFKAPIIFLLPTEVEKAANEACQTQNKAAVDFLQNLQAQNLQAAVNFLQNLQAQNLQAAVDFLQNLQAQNLQDGKKEAKNRIIEEAIDRNLGLTMVKITHQLSSLVRNYFASEVYKRVKKTKPQSLAAVKSSGLRLVIEAGNLAQLRRKIKTQVILIIFLTSKIF